MDRGACLPALLAISALLAAWQIPAAFVARKVIWATATAGGRNCAAACRGFNGRSNEPFKAINTGSGSTPSFLCRASDPSFNGKKRAGFSIVNHGKATPCYGYADGGPTPQPASTSAILSSGSLQCGCVADRSRWQYSSCPAPIWKNHGAAGGKPASQASCKAVCADNGHRNGVEDTPGQARYVCRPAGGSSRIGWSGHQAGIGATTSGIACHFVSRNAVSGESLSVYSFDFQCLCI